MPYFSWNSNKIFYRDEGEGETVLLLPGNTCSSSVHKGDIEYFSQRYRVICPDYHGYGKSGRVESFPIDFWWYNALMCVELINSLQIPGIFVIGTSGGGLIGLNVAILSRGSVKCVVADSIPGEFPGEDDIVSVTNARKVITERQARFWARAHGEDWLDVISLDTRLVVKNARAGESFYKGRLGEIQCPVLLTASLADDLVVNIEGRVAGVARQILSSKAVFYATGAHTLMQSRPDEFRAEVSHFLENLNL
ncbi:alpha/beta fold hydrolase [Pelotomaculum propionicicum]|uniref:alpha/beta fold hydrolase n=1 Tax=Pelotomaculum propionicicum TaxID=258475 RepID=UPI003B7F833C